MAGHKVRCRYCQRLYDSNAALCPCSGDTLVLANPMLGRVLGGRYRFDEHLGGSIFHGVYRCAHITGNREVIVRLMPPGRGRQAAEAARIHHENLPRVIEVGCGDRYDFIASEVVDGLDLDTVIASKRKLRPLLVARIGFQVLRVLTAAHGVGVTHGRLHPRNVVLGKRGGVKLLDLGHGPRDLEAQRPGQRLHALAYLPLEYRPDPIRNASVDVWGLSRMMLELIRGERFGLRHAGFREFEGAAIERVLKRGMAADPAERYANARTLLEELAPEVLSMDLSAPDDKIIEHLEMKPKKKDRVVEFLERRYLASKR